MNKIVLNRAKTAIQDIAIFTMLISGIAHIALSFPHTGKLFGLITTYYGRIFKNEFLIHKTFSTVSGFLLLFLAYHLFKRIRFAWVISILILFASAVFYSIHFRSAVNPMTICEFFIIVVFILGTDDFNRKSNRVSVKAAFLLAGISVFLVLLYASIGFFILKSNYRGIVYFWDSVLTSIQLLFLMDTSATLATTHIGILYAKYVIILNWFCIFIALVLLLKPLIYNPIADEKARKKVRELIQLYGQNPISYLALEHDKTYFLGKSENGAVAYTLAAKVAVCCGDMICSPAHAAAFLMEFMSFCKQNGYAIAMLNVTDHFLPVYQMLGFGCVKYGEDALFKLSDYTLAGGKVASVRAAINHANKEGIEVCEYKPLLHKDSAVEQEIKEVSSKWLLSKKSGELSFMFGGIGLEDPQDRRYFVARARTGEMLGFVVFNPYHSGDGYLAEVTRRLPGAPQGVLEKIIYDAFMIMKDEGVTWGSLGLVPLANARENDKTLIAGKLFEFVYENLNNIYGFKALHHSKRKYAPTHWQSRYLVYYPPIFNAKIAYSIIKAQNPKGISDYILHLLKKQTSPSDNI